MALPAHQWIDILTQRIGTQALLLALGALLVLLLASLALMTIFSIVRTLRNRAAMSTFATNPVLDSNQDDEPMRPALAAVRGMDDSVAFLKKMAKVQQQFLDYNATLASYGQKYGLSVQADLLDSGVFDRKADSYARSTA